MIRCRLLACAVVVAAVETVLATTTHTSATVAQEPDIELTLLDQTFSVAPDDDWTATFLLDGSAADLDALTATTTTTTPTTVTATTAAPGTSPPDAEDAVVVTVRVYQAIVDRAALDAAFAAGDLGLATDRFEVPLRDVVTNNRELTLELTVPTSTEVRESALTMNRPGVYPVSVELRRDDELIAEHVTFVDRLPDEPDDSAPMGIAVVAAIDDPGTAPSADQRASARQQLRALTDVARRADDVGAPLNVAIPSTVEAVLADEPELTDELRDALVSSELFSLPEPQLDPSAAAAAGRFDAFSRALRDGEDTLASLFPQSPTRRAAWNVDAPLSSSAGAQLRDPLGFRLLLLDAATYASLDGNIGDFLDPTLSVDVALADGSTLPATVVSPLGRELVVADDTAARSATDSAVRIVASLLTARRELGPELRRNVALATPGLDLPDADAVERLAGFVEASPELTMTTLSRFVGTDLLRLGDDPVTLRLPDTAGPDLSARAERIDLLRVAAVSAGSMTGDTAVTAEWQTDLDALFSTALSAGAATAEMDRIAGQINAVLTSVHLPEPFSFTLTGRTSMLRVNVRNDAAEDRIVVVRAASSKLRFPSGEQEVTLPPGVTEVLIPVEARSNGTSSVEIQLVTPAFGQQIGAPTFLTARVNALTGLGQVITGAALIILVTWWLSHLRASRRRRALPGAPATAELSLDGEVAVSPDAAEAIAPVRPRQAVGDDG